MSRQIAAQSLGGRLTARNVEGGAEFTLFTPLASPPARG
jgi:signal transduction histidine kinase